MPSTVIRNYEYDAAARVLAIQFVTGRRYLYFEVPAEEVAAMQAVTAKGRYFNSHIRDRSSFREVGQS
jgi:mRNA-degrading endonuclease toxin of MazEF toxin-antitoxin module